MPRALLIEHTVALSPRVAAYLEHRLELSVLRQAVRGKDAEVDDALLAIRTAAAMYIDRQEDELASGLAGSALAKRPEVEGALQCLGSAQVAEAADCTTRAVTMAATAGRLRGAKHPDTGAWTFELRDVVAWLATRPGATTK